MQIFSDTENLHNAYFGVNVLAKNIPFYYLPVIQTETAVSALAVSIL